ncbi:lysozyme-like [Saccostrea echinata]|uniref:lysozyme-like n=1 Tax=Saccostrea echinata TaxID=191078 RepID=UPI002A819553|nr:lysozyme-like [Saccostrea echinata]
MMKVLLALLSLTSVAYGTISDQCLRCICKAESGCQPIGCRLDVYSDSCGYFQIKEAYWKDCGRPGIGWKECSKDYSCAAGCVRTYMNRYIGNSGCPANCESFARIHNGGPKGCTYDCTKQY